MGLENTAEGLRAVYSLATDPRALRAIQRLPGEVGDQIKDLLSTFNAAAKSGTLGFDIQKKVLLPNAPSARPIATTAESSQQLSLPLRTRSGQQVTSRAPRPTARNAETIRAGSRERAVDLPQVRLPGEVRGQMSVFSAPEPQFKYSIHQAPEPEFGPNALPMSLREADSETANLLRSLEPGTAKSLARLADDIAVQYGVSAGEALKNITGPKGTDYLAYLNTSRRAVPAPGGQMSPPPPPAGNGQVPSGGRPGALARTPGGGTQQGATGLGDEVIDVDFRLIRDLPAGRRGGALGVTTTDLGRAVRESGLTPTQLRALIAGGGALGVGTALGLMGREDERQRVTPLTNEQAYPPQGMGRTTSQAPASVPPSVIGQTGSGQVVIAQDDRDSEYRQARSNAMQAAQRGGASAPGAAAPGAARSVMTAPTADPNAPIAKYYQQRQQYVSQPEVLQQIIRDVSALPGAAPQTPIWAAQNPTLAYEMLQRAKARPDLSQQMPQLGTVEVGSQMGDNPVKNAAGNAAYSAAAAVDRSAGAADLEDATRPLIRPKLNYVPLGGRFVPSGGSIPAIPVG